MQTVVVCMSAVSGHLNSQQLLVNSVTQQVGIHLSPTYISYSGRPHASAGHGCAWWSKHVCGLHCKVTDVHLDLGHKEIPLKCRPKCHKLT